MALSHERNESRSTVADTKILRIVEVLRANTMPNKEIRQGLQIVSLHVMVNHNI